MATPNLDHARGELFESVYEPAEDSFLLLDALEADMAAIHALRPRIALEIGSGSGIAITFLGMNVARGSCAFFAVDINERAVAATRLTAEKNGVYVDVVCTDLLAGLDGLDGKVDVVLFNPPYVPTPDEEVGTRDLAAAWAGGERGRRVIDRLIPEKMAVRPLFSRFFAF